MESTINTKGQRTTHQLSAEHQKGSLEGMTGNKKRKSDQNN